MTPVLTVHQAGRRMSPGDLFPFDIHREDNNSSNNKNNNI